MIHAGCDVGSRTAKAVIMEDGEILATHVIPGTPDPERSARQVMEGALEKAGLTLAEVGCCVGTGYGRRHIPFAGARLSEIVCHGRGAHWCRPAARMVIDVGGQDAKAIRIDASGRVERYAYNDKCAAGTGRFLEIMSKPLGIRLEDMGEASLRATEGVKISTQCVIFAETEIVSLLNQGLPADSILKGLIQAMAHRIAALARSIVPARDLVFTGGVARNPGMAAALQHTLGLEVAIPATDPQIIGALGAALLAPETPPGTG